MSGQYGRWRTMRHGAENAASGEIMPPLGAVKAKAGALSSGECD